MSAFQILTRDKQGSDDSAGPDIVSYRLPAAAQLAEVQMGTPRERDEMLNLPQVVLRLPILAGTRRKLPSISIAQVRAHASTIVLVLGSLFALWLIFGGKRPVERPPVDEAPAWAAPGPASAQPAPTEPVAAALPSQPPSATNIEANIAPHATQPEPAPAFENAPIDNRDPASPHLPPPGEPAPQDGTARAMPIEVRTATRPEETRWDGGNRVAPGEAAPLGIGTGVPQ
jgi:hypothetical protein